jgi:hydrogenase maturation protease
MGRSPIIKRGLVIGIGNVLRQDDGLGPKTVAFLDELSFDGYDVGTIVIPQIDITLASTLASVDYAIFVDAGMNDSDDQIKIIPYEHAEHDSNLSHTSHALSIPSLIEITSELYGRAPISYMVIPKGYDFSVGERLSPQAEANMLLAVNQIVELIGTASK